jgi:hypothetical protein
MAIGQKQVWAKVLDFTVQDYDTRAVLFQVRYAKDVSIGEQYTKLEIEGGSDNEVLATIYHSPKATFKASLPLVDDNVMVAKTGATKKTGAQLNSFDQIFTVDATAGTVDIGYTPIAGTLKIYNIDADENLGTEITAGEPTTEVEQYSIATDTVTFNTGKKGKQVLIVCNYTTGVDATGIIFIGGKLPEFIRITAKTKVEDKAGNKAVKTILVEKAKSDPNFDFSTSAGTASVLPFECDVFGWINEDGANQFFRMVTDPDLAI